MSSDYEVRNAKRKLAEAEAELDKYSKKLWASRDQAEIDRLDYEVRRWKYNVSSYRRELDIAEQSYERSRK